MGPSWVQILIVAVAVVLLLGRGKISSLMGEVAQGIRAFRKGMGEDDSTLADDKTLPLEADFSQQKKDENSKAPANEDTDKKSG